MKKRLCDSCIHCECSKSDNPISTVVSCGVTVDCLDYKSVDSAKEVNCEECIYNIGKDLCVSDILCVKNSQFMPRYKHNIISDETRVTEINQEEKEMINHPSHYTQGIEAIDYIESHRMDFNIGNVIKYVTRAKHKGTELQDLKKALWYLDREIKRLEKGE